MTPTITAGLSYAEYAALPGLRWSLLKHLVPPSTPAHYQHALLAPRVDKDEYKLGRLVHQLILGGDELFAPIGDRRTKANKEREADCHAEGRTPIAQADWDAAHAMHAALLSSTDAKALLTARGNNEVVVQWERDGVPLKARLDRVIDGAIIELKTAVNASPNAMGRALQDKGYCGQLGFYSMALDAVAPMPRRCWIIAIEKAPPYCIGVYPVREEAILQGRRIAEDALSRDQRCAEEFCWPGYPSVEIDLPKWEREYE